MDEEKEFDLLPVTEYKEVILDSLRQNQIFICISETGSGKTTQIPQFCLDNGLIDDSKMIAITQPRRVAAITVAQRVAEERNVSLGGEVGYTVRFDDQTSSKTKIKYMTDGILLRECLTDPSLSKYSVVMLDEAHERSISTDILFGLVKSACKQRPQLRVIVTSATLDVDKFAQYFNRCPVVRVPGRIFPVDIFHSKNKQVMVRLHIYFILFLLIHLYNIINIYL
jgi:ATP-dependent RNA helicase DHX8/PRP22